MDVIQDLYSAEHGKYVMRNAPGLEGLGVLGFPKAYYDKTDHKMKPKDKSRADDFISISGIQ